MSIVSSILSWVWSQKYGAGSRCPAPLSVPLRTSGYPVKAVVL